MRVVKIRKEETDRSAASFDDATACDTSGGVLSRKLADRDQITRDLKGSSGWPA